MNEEVKIKKAIGKLQRKSDEKSAEIIIAHYYHEIYCYVYKQTVDKELSMDLTQEIFVSMLQTIHKYNAKKATFRTWLYRISTYKVVDYFRGKAFQTSLNTEPLNLAVVDETDYTIDIMRKIELETIIDSVNQMDVLRQKIFRLKIFGEYTFKEISAMLKLPESTVKTNFYATQKWLKSNVRGGNYHEKR